MGFVYPQWCYYCPSSEARICFKHLGLGLLAQMFFGLLALTMVGVKYKSDKRDRYLQHGGWFVKIALWLLFIALPFFFPIGLINAYGRPKVAYRNPGLAFSI